MPELVYKQDQSHFVFARLSNHTVKKVWFIFQTFNTLSHKLKIMPFLKFQVKMSLFIRKKSVKIMAFSYKYFYKILSKSSSLQNLTNDLFIGH